MVGEQFWRLEPPTTTQRLAEWESSVRLESVVCPEHPGHQRAGRRIGQLSVVLPPSVNDDIIWTWQGDCLIQAPVLDLLESQGITGYAARPAAARRELGTAGVPPLSELIVTGWGGLARPSSGIVLDPIKSCTSCGLLVYSGMTNATELFDREQWDGSDIFMIWPLPRFIVVSDRLARLLRAEEFTGLFLNPIEDLPETAATLSPGRLSYWMPDDRAQALGKPLGID